MKFIILKTDETYEIKESGERFLDFCYREIGCDCIDRVSVARGLDFWVDDEGMYTQKLNVAGTALAMVLGYHSFLYGNIVVSGIDYDKGETLSVPEKWLKMIENYYKIAREYEDDAD